ncbi:MAG TPA: molybdate ABC transporter substrate-binding protein [Actinomycetota bacterium]
MRRSVVAAVAALVVLSGCTAPSGRLDDHSSTSITVLAAASLTRVFPLIGQGFSKAHPGVSVRFSFAGTDALVTQIEQGARGDVFAGASGRYADRLSTAGLIDPPYVMCTNSLVMVVPGSNPAGIASLRDLERPGLKIVVGSDTVPVGVYTRTALRLLDSIYGPDFSKRVLDGVVSEEPDAETILAKVRSGEADAGFVYQSDALAAAMDVRAFPLPSVARLPIQYPIAVLKGSGHRASADAFVRYVLARPGQRILRSAGFGPPLSPAGSG